MASDVEIVNYALSLLGDKAITSLSPPDDTERARLANRIYGPTRDAVLRAHPWNCAVERATLAKLAAAPIHGWESQFTLPTDPYCLRVLALNDDEEAADPGDDFKVEGRKLLSNTAAANIRYIKRITDPNEYDGLLYQALVHRLAAAMAYAITGSTTVAGQMWTLYAAILREARGVDGQEGSPDRTDITTLLDVR